eukprot:jgi/Chrzof1/12478/Cz06g35230.t1
MATLFESSPEVINGLQAKLKDPCISLPQKYRVLFSLRNIKGHQAHAALATALQDSSALFRHDVAFCMGQRQDPAAVEVLTHILHDAHEHPMVRHEAGEALGAIGREECLVPLREHLDDAVQEVAETCQLALQRIEYFQQNPASSADESSPYYSVDPTPPFPNSIPLEDLRRILLDPHAKMFDRFRALFALRNRATASPEAVSILGEVFDCSSALLKHEVAYVLGQLQHPDTVQVLGRVLRDPAEHAMVRHEAAEALGAIAAPGCVELLQAHAADEEPIVAHSCVVALDVLEFEKSGSFEYADK